MLHIDLRQSCRLGISRAGWAEVDAWVELETGILKLYVHRYQWQIWSVLQSVSVLQSNSQVVWRVPVSSGKHPGLGDNSFLGQEAEEMLSGTLNMNMAQCGSEEVMGQYSSPQSVSISLSRSQSYTYSQLQTLLRNKVRDIFLLGRVMPLHYPSLLWFHYYHSSLCQYSI